MENYFFQQAFKSEKSSALKLVQAFEVVIGCLCVPTFSSDQKQASILLAYSIHCQCNFSGRTFFLILSKAGFHFW